MTTSGEFVSFIEGWGLNNPDESAYELRETGQYAGFCQSDTCFHNSHDPYGPVMRLTLKASLMDEKDARPGTPYKTVYVGETGDDAWYTGPSSATLLRIHYTQHYNDHADIVHIKHAPISIEQAYFSMPREDK